MNSVASNILRYYLRNYQANGIYPSDDPKDRFINAAIFAGADAFLNRIDDNAEMQNKFWSNADIAALLALGYRYLFINPKQNTLRQQPYCTVDFYSQYYPSYYPNMSSSLSPPPPLLPLQLPSPSPAIPPEYSWMNNNSQRLYYDSTELPYYHLNMIESGMMQSPTLNNYLMASAPMISYYPRLVTLERAGLAPSYNHIL